MSFVNTAHTTNSRFITRSAAALGHPLSFARLIAERIRNRRELNYVLGLSDYQLKDIGVSRADIEREAIKPLWRA